MRSLFRLLEHPQHLRTRWQCRGRGPVIAVHQMARVGSKSIRAAIREHATSARSFHTHYLNPVTIERMRSMHRRRIAASGRPGLYREHLHACWLADRIRRRDFGDWKIITLVRDPVARTVSAFFRHLPLNHPELGERYRDDPANVPQLIELFHSTDEFEHDFALEWFDREVRDVFGIDVYASPGPAPGSGRTYQCDAGSMLLLRTEDLDAGGGRALGDFLGIGAVRLSHSNRSADLGYAETYRRFIGELRLGPAYLDRMYESRLARHFYSDDERAAFRDRWRSTA